MRLAACCHVSFRAGFSLYVGMLVFMDGLDCHEQSKRVLSSLKKGIHPSQSFILEVVKANVKLAFESG